MPREEGRKGGKGGRNKGGCKGELALHARAARLTHNGDQASIRHLAQSGALGDELAVDAEGELCGEIGRELLQTHLACAKGGGYDGGRRRGRQKARDAEGEEGRR